MKIKPADIDLHFGYNCPYCKSTHWFSMKESQMCNNVECYCGQILSTTPLQNIEVNFTTGNGNKHCISDNRSQYKKLIQQVVDILSAQGFSVKLVKQKVMHILANNKKEWKVQDLVKKILSQM